MLGSAKGCHQKYRMFQLSWPGLDCLEVSVWVSNSDGTDPVRVSKGLGATPEWSPDGKRIVFDNNEGGRWDIWVMNADGGQEIRLTGDSSDHRAPSWSADGEWVYFTSNRSGVWEIWKVSLASKQSLQVTQHGGGYAAGVSGWKVCLLPETQYN